VTASEVFYDSGDGLRLFARDWGGPGSLTLLCLPGLTRNSRDFADLAAHYAGRYRVIAADQRGRGRSQWDPDPTNYQPPVYVGDMVALLDHLGLDRVAIVGTSLGGLMGMGIAATMPERVAGLVLNDVGPVFDPAGLDRIRVYVGRVAAAKTWDEAVTEMTTLYGAAFPDYGRAEWEKQARAVYREDGGTLALDYDPAIAVGLNADSGALPDLWPLFRLAGRVPLLALRGERSDLLTAETFAEMARRVPSLETAIIPRRGHAPGLDEPEALAALDRFLERIAAAEAATSPGIS
jgi:pimeloyl-ACP methyl ester carboxylesterase